LGKLPNLKRPGVAAEYPASVEIPSTSEVRSLTTLKLDQSLLAQGTSLGLFFRRWLIGLSQ
jgi:hypothetical protein